MSYGLKRGGGVSGKYNPFRPDKIAPPGIFAGRMDELKAIDQCLLQTKNGNPQHFLIEGERGIGKSSIFLCELLVAVGKLETFQTKATLNFLVLNLSLQDKDTYFSILKKIATELRNVLSRRDAFKSFVLSAIDFVSRIEAAGVRVRASADVEPEDDELLGLLQTDLVRVIETLDDQTDGVLLLIDEADRPPSDAGLGLICKLLSEDMTKRACDRLCIGLAGLPNLIDRLRESHESAPRIFKTMTLKPLEDHESKQVLDMAMSEAAKKNGFQVTITDEAKALIATLSEGYPHFLQEFGYCAFEQDSDNVIDRVDVTESLFRENGAFDQLGRKYFNQYYSTPSSDDYRTVLDTMAGHMVEWVARADLITESGLKASTVDNALRALKEKNIIIQNEMRAGQYRLPTRSFAVWIKARKTAAAARESGPNLFDRGAED